MPSPPRAGISVLVESSFSSSKGGLLTDAVDGDVELVKGGAEWPRQRVGSVNERGCVGPQNSQVEFAVEERHATTVRREEVRVAAPATLDHVSKAEPAQVVRHLTSGIRLAEQGRDARSKVAVTEAGRHMGKPAEGLQHRQHPRIRQAKGAYTPCADPHGEVQAVLALP